MKDSKSERYYKVIANIFYDFKSERFVDAEKVSILASCLRNILVDNYEEDRLLMLVDVIAKSIDSSFEVVKKGGDTWGLQRH